MSAFCISFMNSVMLLKLCEAQFPYLYNEGNSSAYVIRLL